MKPSNDYKNAIQVVEVTLEPPKDDEALIKNIFAAVNANDVNIIANQPERDLPFDIGIEVCLWSPPFIP